MISLFFCTLIISPSSFSSTRPITAIDIYQINASQLIWFDKYGLTLSGLSFSLLMDDLGIELDTFLAPEHSAEHGPTQSELDRAYTNAAIYTLNKIKQTNSEIDSYEYLDILTMAQNNVLADHVTRLLPLYDEVSRLRGMIRHYKTIAKNTWVNIEASEFRLGQSNRNILRLRKRLVMLGDIEAIEGSSLRASIFDPSLIQGIRDFQKRHGIEENGNLDKMTSNMLNVTPQQRITLMQINLWRRFRLPSALPSRYVKINIPAFELKLIEKEDKVLDMKVIVGKPQTPTPTIITELTQLTVNPSWTPPWSIVRSELIPRNKRQPGYLKHQRFKLRRLDDFTLMDIEDISSMSLNMLLANHQLIQSPGPKNALGRYRFTIPNKYTIFLHDTPTKSLFFYQNRALSHGCIRLSNPKGLSNYLMRDDKRSAAVKKASSDKSTHSFKLPEPLPVYITYHTSWVDELGKLQFRPDIYNLDGEVKND